MLKRVCLVLFCLYPALLLLNGVTVDILCRNIKVALDVCAVNMYRAQLLLIGVTFDILCCNVKVVLDVCAVNMLK